MRVSCRANSNRQVDRVKRLLTGAYSNGVLFSKAKDIFGSTNDVDILKKLKALKVTKIKIENP